MKTRIMILLLSLLLILPFATTASALAGFETEAVSDKVKQQAIANTNMQLITEPGHVSSIACFDISETGLVGIGVDVPGTKQIHVMDLNGNPLYGYSFDSAGSFGFSFEGENVAIYFNRSDIIEVYDSEGQCVDVRKAVTSSSNYTECVQEILDATEKQIGGNLFRLERDIGFLGRSYSRLVCVDEYGDKTIVFDATLPYNIAFAFRTILAVVFIIGLGYLLVRKVKAELYEEI